MALYRQCGCAPFRRKRKKAKELMESGRTRGKSGHGNPGLSSATVRSLHLMLHNALNRAVKERLILRNPTEDCIAPKVQKFEMQILQPEHIKTYLDAAEKRGLLPCSIWNCSAGCARAS